MNAPWRIPELLVLRLFESRSAPCDSTSSKIHFTWLQKKVQTATRTTATESTGFEFRSCDPMALPQWCVLHRGSPRYFWLARGRKSQRRISLGCSGPLPGNRLHDELH